MFTSFFFDQTGRSRSVAVACMKQIKEKLKLTSAWNRSSACWPGKVRLFEKLARPASQLL